MLIAFGNIARRFGVGRPPPSALGAFGTSGRVRVRLAKSRGQVLWAFGFAGLGVLRRTARLSRTSSPIQLVPARGGKPAVRGFSVQDCSSLAIVGRAEYWRV